MPSIPINRGLQFQIFHRNQSRAANKSVDFSTLFLGLGFFIILSAFILLILVVSTFYESKKDQVMTLYSIGFANREIEKMLFLESGLIAVTGALLGAFAGGLFNIIIIRALNSVWLGAVQTNTLISGFDPLSMLFGFVVTIIVILLILKIRSSGFLKHLSKAETGITGKPSAKKNLLLSVIFLDCDLYVNCFVIFAFRLFNTTLLFCRCYGLCHFDTADTAILPWKTKNRNLQLQE